jgi:minor fimbrial subunit
LWVGAVAGAHAQGCTPDGGPHIFRGDQFASTISSVAQNQPGTVIEDAYTFSYPGTYSATCDTAYSVRGPAYVTTTSDLPRLDTDAQGRTWYKLNDYLAVATQGWVHGNTQSYFNVPFISKSNTLQYAPGISWASGGRGKVSIKILRPFVGFAFVNKMVMKTQISLDPNTGPNGPHMSETWLAGQVISPQTCELNAGQTVAMDFGEIGAPLFSQAGAGNRPAGVNPQTRNIHITCKSIDAATMLSLRLEADSVSGQAMVSDNKDIGFIVADGTGKALTPNTLGSNIPFRLDDNASADVAIMAWPVSVTGHKPAEGKFTARGYLRVDFD